MPELKGMDYLKSKLKDKKIRTRKRYMYYEMKNETEYFGKTLPEGYQWLSHALGWSSKAVDSIADRLAFSEFRDDNFYMEEIYTMNNPDILFDSAILSALITSCSFLYICMKDEYPSIQVIDGGHATGVIDDTTNLLKEGYAVLESDNFDNPTLEAYFIPGRTDYYTKDGLVSSVENDALYPLLVPIINRPDAKRPFGHSRISRACMSIQQAALRTIKRSEISAEFYSFPQKYVLGMNDEAEFNNVKATISSFLRIDKDSEGDKPVLGQFQQQSMAPFVEQLRMFASLFGAETGLTLDDLGFPSENPSSSEAIKAAHENLRLMVRKAQKTFSVGFINAGYLAACIRDKACYQRNAVYRTKIAWEPIFEPDFSALSSIGDGIIKINQAMPDYINEKTMTDLTGIKYHD